MQKASALKNDMTSRLSHAFPLLHPILLHIPNNLTQIVHKIPLKDEVLGKLFWGQDLPKIVEVLLPQLNSRSHQSAQILENLLDRKSVV